MKASCCANRKSPPAFWLCAVSTPAKKKRRFATPSRLRVFRLRTSQALARARQGAHGDRAATCLSISKSTLAWRASESRWLSCRRLLKASSALPEIELEGVFSHLASSEVLDDEDTVSRLRVTSRPCARSTNMDLRPSLRHLANSGAVCARPDTWYNFVRPGLSLYGYEQQPVYDGLPRQRCSGTAAKARACMEDAYSGIARCSRRAAPGLQRRIYHALTGAHRSRFGGIR